MSWVYVRTVFSTRREERETSSPSHLSLCSALALGLMSSRESIVYFNRSVYRQLPPFPYRYFYSILLTSPSSFSLCTPAHHHHTQFQKSFSFPSLRVSRTPRSRCTTQCNASFKKKGDPQLTTRLCVSHESCTGCAQCSVRDRSAEGGIEQRGRRLN